MGVQAGPGAESVRDLVVGDHFWWGPYHGKWYEGILLEDGFRIVEVDTDKIVVEGEPNKNAAQCAITIGWADGFLGLKRERPTDDRLESDRHHWRVREMGRLERVRANALRGAWRDDNREGR